MGALLDPKRVPTDPRKRPRGGHARPNTSSLGGLAELNQMVAMSMTDSEVNTFKVQNDKSIARRQVSE